MQNTRTDGLIPDPRFPSHTEFKTHGGWLTTVNLRALARYPGDVVVSENVLRSAIVLEVSCHPDDHQPLIGEQRRVASAIQTLLHTLGANEGDEYILGSVPLEILSVGDERDGGEVLSLGVQDDD